MTKYEALIAEYDEELEIEEHNMKNDGLYCDNFVWINKNMCENKKCCILAEEIGHYFTSSGDILNQTDINNAKQEYRARAWAVEKILPYKEFVKSLNSGCKTIPEIAEFLDIDEDFLKESIEHYKCKLGVEFPIAPQE